MAPVRSTTPQATSAPRDLQYLTGPFHHNTAEMVILVLGILALIFSFLIILQVITDGLAQQCCQGNMYDLEAQIQTYDKFYSTYSSLFPPKWRWLRTRRGEPRERRQNDDGTRCGEGDRPPTYEESEQLESRRLLVEEDDFDLVEPLPDSNDI